MEHVIHYIWKHKILKPDLKTTSGEKVEVIDPGTYNRDEGPDFFNAKIKIGDTVWAGNVEIHDNASDWYRHNHQNNKAYDNVILHVCLNCDCNVTRPDGTAMPTLKIECPEHVRQNYDTLKSNDIFPACHTVIEKIPHIMHRSWLTYLQSERLEQKAGAISTMLEKQHGNMEDTFFIMLSRNFGFGVNNDAFQQWAASLPLRAVDKHRDNLMQVESIFFGMALARRPRPPAMETAAHAPRQLPAHQDSKAGSHISRPCQPVLALHDGKLSGGDAGTARCETVRLLGHALHFRSRDGKQPPAREPSDHRPHSHKHHSAVHVRIRQTERNGRHRCENRENHGSHPAGKQPHHTLMEQDRHSHRQRGRLASHNTTDKKLLHAEKMPLLQIRI